MKAWDDLVTAALLGTDRRLPTLDRLPAPLARAVEAVSGGAGSGTVGSPADPAAAALDVAAVITTYRRAGGLPSTPGEPVEPAPLDLRSVVPEPAAHRLADILAAGDSDLLGEWLQLAERQAFRAPHRILPTLLDRGRERRALRNLITAVAGPRGRWLASLNPAWAYVDEVADAHGEPDQDVWAHGRAADRVAYLATLRSRDARAARELLAGGWATESPADRAALLGVLADGLAADDEALLETALGDRRKEVRTVAADLLTSMPGSALAARMAERALVSVQLNRKFLHTTLTVELPRDCDAAMRRDRVTPKPPHGWGERAWWLAEILGRTRPALWQEEFRASPADLVGWARKTEWWSALHAGWAAAAVRFEDAAWARALLDVELTAELIGVLPSAERAERVAAALRQRVGEERVIDLLNQCARPWPPALGEAVLGRLAGATAKPSWLDHELSRHAARALPVELLAHADLLATGAQQSESALSNALTDLARVLRIRADMIRELTPGVER